MVFDIDFWEEGIKNKSAVSLPPLLRA